MVGVFIDTIVVCTATAMIIIVTGSADPELGYEGAQVTMNAFSTAFPSFGAQFLAIALLFFAFTTIIGWYYFGEANVKYLFDSQLAVRIYQVLVLGFIIMGTLFKINVVWELADMFNGLMVIPNIIGLVFLLSEARTILEDYNHQIHVGEPLHYDYKYESINRHVK